MMVTRVRPLGSPKLSVTSTALRRAASAMPSSHLGVQRSGSCSCSAQTRASPSTGVWRSATRQGVFILSGAPNWSSRSQVSAFPGGGWLIRQAGGGIHGARNTRTAAEASQHACNEASGTSSTEAASRLPVMLLSGFLGAGKTTTLKHVLSNQENLRVAVVVNDVADINIDEKLLKDAKVHDSSMVELSNGCVCCSLREDLISIIRAVAKKNTFDLLIVEGTGVALPMPVAASFEFVDEDGSSLQDVSYLDTITTVVDAPRFVNDVMEAKDLAEVGMEEHEEDNRVVSDILVEQVEFADLLLVNKTDCVSKEDLEKLLSLLSELNPKAQILTSEYGNVPVRDLVLTRRYDVEKVSEAAGWLEKLTQLAEARKSAGSEHKHGHGSHGHSHDNHHEHHHDHQHGHNDEHHSKHGISSFVYAVAKPFHPERLAEELSQAWPGLLRSKGFFWLASRNDTRGLWQTAGQSWSGEYSGPWDAALSAEELEEEGIDTSRWHPKWGDRMQELVFIGIGMDKEHILARLDGCLLTDEEMAAGPAAWSEYADPLPDWDIAYE